MFSFKKQKATKVQNEYLDKQVKKLPRIVFIIFLIYFLLFAIYIGWYAYFKSTYTLSEIYGVSMKNTINPNCYTQNDSDDLAYVNPNKKVERQDIIIVYYKFINEKGKIEEMHLSKRAIAFGGEYITIKKSEDDDFYHVYLYDEESGEESVLEEDYVRDYSDWTRNVSAYNDGAAEYEGLFYDYFLDGENDERAFKVETFNGIKYLQVPEDEILFLGDNRDNSMDARIIGPATLGRIEGVAEIILSDANKPGANVLWIKIKSIFSYYWNKLARFFAR